MVETCLRSRLYGLFLSVISLQSAKVNAKQISLDIHRNMWPRDWLNVCEYSQEANIWSRFHHAVDYTTHRVGVAL